MLKIIFNFYANDELNKQDESLSELIKRADEDAKKRTKNQRDQDDYSDDLEICR